MDKTEIEKLKEIFNSIMCLAVEGPDVMRLIEIVDKIAKESERGYDLCCRHLTSAIYPDGEDRCPECEARRKQESNENYYKLMGIS